MKKYHLYGAIGCGSVLAELFLTAAGIPFTLTELKWEERKKWKKVFGHFNPLLQLPTLVINNKLVLTESLAIAVHCDKKGAKLIPKGARADDFWRWAIFIVANIYPTFTYRDNAAEYLPQKSDQETLSKNIMKKRKKLWRQIEESVQGPWFLGKEYSAIDMYIAVMIHWTPGKDWFEKNCPQLFKIAQKVLLRKLESGILYRHIG